MIKKISPMLIIIIVIFSRCNRCEIDLKGIQLYNDNLNKYERWNFFDTLYRDSLVCLGNKFGDLTGHEPQFAFGFSPTYFLNEKNEDIKAWKDWLDKNKCTVTYKKFNETMKIRN